MRSRTINVQRRTAMASEGTGGGCGRRNGSGASARSGWQTTQASDTELKSVLVIYVHSCRGVRGEDFLYSVRSRHM